MIGLRLYAALGVGAAFLLLAAWGLRVDHLRDNWRTRYITETGEVTATIRRVTGNVKLQWKDASRQIEGLAISRDSWKAVAGEQTAAIDAMGLETARLQRLNAELRAKALKAIAQRQNAIDKLERSALTPGDKANCQQQIQAANAALDAVFEEGL